MRRGSFAVSGRRSGGVRRARPRPGRPTRRSRARRTSRSAITPSSRTSCTAATPTAGSSGSAPATRRILTRSSRAHWAPRGEGLTETTAAGLPSIAAAPRGREAQSIAFLSTPVTEPLYSGVATTSASAAATASRKATTEVGGVRRRRGPGRSAAASRGRRRRCARDALGQQLGDRRGHLPGPRVGPQAAHQHQDLHRRFRHRRTSMVQRSTTPGGHGSIPWQTRDHVTRGNCRRPQGVSCARRQFGYLAWETVTRPPVAHWPRRSGRSWRGWRPW